MIVKAGALKGKPLGQAIARAKTAGTARDLTERVDFPTFVAELLAGTFQAVVDALTQQMREYLELLRAITKAIRDFEEQPTASDDDDNVGK